MVRHFLKDGTQIESVEGIVIKREDFKGVYEILEQVEKRMGDPDEKTA